MSRAAKGGGGRKPESRTENANIATTHGKAAAGEKPGIQYTTNKPISWLAETNNVVEIEWFEKNKAYMFLKIFSSERDPPRGGTKNGRASKTFIF